MSYASNYVKTTMVIGLVRATHHCLRGSCVPLSAMSKQHWPYKDGAGIGFLLTTDLKFLSLGSFLDLIHVTLFLPAV
eukprot:15355718-Ditylum_brightwellii.AAC.1